MIVRLSQKLGKKLKVTPDKKLAADENPFADWSAHLFTADRAQYVIVTNTPSLYSVVLFGRGISDDSRFLERVLSAIREQMTDDGMELAYTRLVASTTATIQYSKALNRSVTGSMNDLVVHAKWWLTEREFAPFDVSEKLNEIPMSALKYRNPQEALKELSHHL